MMMYSVTEFLPHYEVHCDLALNRCTVTMNLQKYVFGSPSVVFYHWKPANLISSLIVSYSLINNEYNARSALENKKKSVLKVHKFNSGI